MLRLIHWKRALLLAAINVAAAGPMMLMLENRMAEQIRDREQSESVGTARMQLAGSDRAMRPRLVVVQEGETVTFTPCGMWVNYPTQMDVVVFGNIPAEFLTQWQMECPPAWSIEGRIVGTRWLPMTQHGLALRRRADLAFLALIAVEWLLIGAFPLQQTTKFYGESGSFITACTLLGSALALIRPIDILARLPALIAVFAWFWWLGLLLWVILRPATRSLLRLRKSR
jgi:hypothetical protein